MTTLRWKPEAQDVAPAYPIEDPGAAFTEPAVNPRAGRDIGYPTMAREEIEFQQSINDRTRADVDAGIWPYIACLQYGMPTRIEDVPEPVKSVIMAEAAAQGISPAQAGCNLIQMDPWRMMGDLLFVWMLANGAELQPDFRTCEPPHIDLVGRANAQSYVNQCSQWGLDTAFDGKYFDGGARPYQEADLAKAVYTAYPKGDGGDEHPEWPGGHPKNAGGAFVGLRRTLVAPDSMWQTVLLALLLLGFLRHFARVHHAQTCIDSFFHIIRMAALDPSMSELLDEEWLMNTAACAGVAVERIKQPKWRNSSC